MAYRVECIADAIAVSSNIKLQHDRTLSDSSGRYPVGLHAPDIVWPILYIPVHLQYGIARLHDLHEQGKRRSSVE